MNTIEKIQRIKELRTKPEEKFLIDILDKVEFVYDDEYPDSEFYRVDGEVLFEQDSKNERFWIHYDKIWSVLQSEFNLNYQEINELVKGWVWERLNRKVDTPESDGVKKDIEVWERLKIKVDTPVKPFTFHISQVWERLKRKVDIPQIISYRNMR